MTITSFSDFELLPQVFQAVEQQGYTTPTEIQVQTIPLILKGNDVVGQANTGTGKTAAFALPLLCRIDLSVQHPQVLVLAPTRELAIQVAEAFETYAKNLPSLKVATIYGGQSYGIQINQLKRGAHVVVGTPGRVMDHMRRGNLKLDHLNAFALDEADEMLRMGFADDVQWILSEAPSERQTLLFSATMPPKLRRIAEKYLTDPSHISTTSKTMTTTTVLQRACLVSPREKLPLLARIFESEPTEGVIVFVKTKEMSTRLAENLCQRGYQASALNGDMAQNQRERTVERLKKGKLDVLVATDVAARGLDVERISHVINYDFPHDTEGYVHRIGRTGRAGRDGNAILFVGPRERHQLRHLEKATGQPMTWMERPSNEEIQATRANKLKEQLSEMLAKPSFAKKLEMSKCVVEEFLAENPELNAEQLASALVTLAMKGREVEDDTRGGGRFEGKGGDRNGRERGGRERGPRSDRRERFSRDKKFGDGEGRDSSRGGARRKASSMVKYRIEVGHTHGVRPGNIVGAIANESGLSGSDIGGIDIQTHFSTVDLPQGLPEDLLRNLQKLRVAGQPLNIAKWDAASAPAGPKGSDKPRRFTKKKKNDKPSWKKTHKAAATK